MTSHFYLRKIRETGHSLFELKLFPDSSLLAFPSLGRQSMAWIRSQPVPPPDESGFLFAVRAYRSLAAEAAAASGARHSHFLGRSISVAEILSEGCGWTYNEAMALLNSSQPAEELWRYFRLSSRQGKAAGQSPL